MGQIGKIITFLVIIGTIMATKQGDELRFVSVLLRHGDRTPETHETWVNDPHYEDDFYPMGHGGLTNDGKMRQFEFGKVLRKRWGEFLGNYYVPADVFARSTNCGRTIMSVSLILASLYSPMKSQIWNSQLNWQPIPIMSLPEDRDFLLAPHKKDKYLEEYERVKAMPEVKEKLEKFHSLMNNLTIYTGEKINTSRAMLNLYCCLVAESSMGLEMPEWTKLYFPYGPLRYGSLLEYEIANYNDRLKALNGGVIVKRIAEDMVAVINNGTREAGKINLFSAHETNVAAVLHTLGVWQPHIPEYSSAVLFELIKRGGCHFVQLSYYLGIPSAIKPLKMPGCNELCPIDDFLRLMNKFISVK